MSDPDSWSSPIGVNASGDTDFIDTGVIFGNTYYYSVTAYDNHNPNENQSWYGTELPVVLMDITLTDLRKRLGKVVAGGDTYYDLNNDGRINCFVMGLWIHLTP